MEKKKAIAKIVLISLLAVLLIVFSIISFMPAGSLNGFAGFAGAIEKGMDFEGGIYANYTPSKIGEMTDEEFQEAINSTYDRVNSLIEQKGYEDARVYLTSDNKIRIESPNQDDAASILALIGSGELKIKTSASADAEAVLVGSNVTSAFAMQDPTTYYWGTYIGFDEEGSEILSDLTEDATSSSPVYLYFYRGDSTSYFFYLPISSHVTNSFLFISTSTGSMTSTEAVNLAIQVQTGSYDTILTINGSVGEISPSAGNEALLGLSIAAGVAALLIIVVFAIVYREFGLMAIVSILLYIGAVIFFMQAVPIITLSSASLGGALVGLILIAALHFILFEKIRAEYALGKKLNVSIKTGYKKSAAIIAEIGGALAIIFTVAYFICTGAMKSFSMIMIVCSLLSLLITLFFTYHLNKSYSALNPENGNRANFSREEEANEIQ